MKRVARYLQDRTERKESSVHHIIGRCNSDWANVNHPDNKVVIRNNVHHAINTLFNQNQSPKEQLEQLRDMYDSVLSDVAKALYDDLIGLENENFYKKWLVK